MHSLKFISKTFDIPLSKVAEQLGIRRQSVNEWVGKRQKSIPKKHLPKLSALFNLDESWFEKTELKPSEQIEIQRIKLARDVTYIEVPVNHVDDEGNVHEGVQIISPEEQEDEELRFKQNVRAVVEGIEEQLSNYPYQGGETLDFFQSVLVVLNSKDSAHKRMMLDVVDYLRDLETLGFDTKPRNNSSDIENLLSKYKK
ncbi:hypothetical protein [Alkalihalophilus marmarensis]|uniref:hypothetical protein n=1 Tax=Alkalihalophilus marmarensis TaxID=521377 RepID=UPI002E1D0546|nr:hypothetical protein [Alkalihalophilus marmarensis]